MEVVITIATAIAAEIGKCLVGPSIGHVRYLLHFKRNGEDLKTQQEDLRLEWERVKHDVIKERYAKLIEGDVQKWLTDVENILGDVGKLETEIQLSKTCFNGWCPNWSWRYRISKKATKEKDKMANLQDKMAKLQEKSNYRVSYQATLTEISSAKDFKPFGTTTSAFNQIMEALRDEKNYVIGLHGTGGVGKTTLAKEVGEKAKKKGLFKVVAMATVSQTPDFRKIQEDIASFFGLKFDGPSELERVSLLCSRLKQEKNILIILDDVWTKLNLTDDIGIPYGDDHKGCKILLTTRNLDVCRCMDSMKDIPLGLLSETEAWDLFKERATLDNNSPSLNVAKEVARKCKGLPLAIVAVGTALKGKNADHYEQASKQLDKFKKLKFKFVDTKVVGIDIYACLRLSYDYLKDEETKLCFLLCSLFPEDYEIDIEDLVRCGIDLFKDNDSIDDARRQLRVIINDLKSSSLLLEASYKGSLEQQFVKMHDVVRDVALLIASKGANEFMKGAYGGPEWPKEGSEQYTVISLLAEKIKVLPSKVECPRLEILLLSGEDSLIVPDTFFKGVKALKVLTLRHGSWVLQSLEFLTNLQMLQVEYCKFSDISSLGKLKRLKVLSFRGSDIKELSNEVGELNNLRLLDLTYCHRLKRIPPDVMRRLLLLEELYIGGYHFNGWEIEGRSIERSNASISELNALSCLAVLSMNLTPQCLPQHFSFHNLLRYDIWLTKSAEKFIYSGAVDYPRSRELFFHSIDASSEINAFKELFQTVELLRLEDTYGCKNIIPNMDQGGLNDLISLVLISCDEMECLINSTQQPVPITAFSNLKKLSLNKITHLREIWKGPTQHVNLQRLIDVQVSNCSRLTYVFSSSLARSVVQLQRLKIDKCEGLEQIISIEKEDGEISSEDHPQPPYFSKLATLEVTNCEKLEYIFSISIARGLRQVEKLQILDCPQLKQVFSHRKEEDVCVGDGKDIELPKLRKIELKGLSSLTNFSEGNYQWMWPSLQELTVVKCPKLTTFFITDLEAKLRALEKQLRVLRIGNHSQLLKAVILLQNLEELTIEDYEGVEEVFHGNSSFSNLKELKLEDLPELRVIWKGPTQISSFQNLTQIYVINCNKLTHILTPSLARNLPRLETLWIKGCEELERIIGEEDKDEEDQIISFPNLDEISVRDCNKLKSLFPITIARGLSHLSILHISRAPQLEEVFSHENEEDVRDEKNLLPRLCVLHLLELPRLISFCRGGYHFIFPYFLRLRVKDCPNIITSFTIASDNRTVHAIDKAKTEAPQLLKEDILEGSSSTQATVVTNHSDIFWDYHHSNPDTLPPYVEESSGKL